MPLLECHYLRTAAQSGDSSNRLARPRAWYEYASADIPLFLFAGGFLGGLFGLGAVYSNARVFRNERFMVAKPVLSGLISVGVTVAFFISASVLEIMLESDISQRVSADRLNNRARFWSATVPSRLCGRGRLRSGVPQYQVRSLSGVDI